MIDEAHHKVEGLQLLEFKYEKIYAIPAKSELDRSRSKLGCTESNKQN
jgi:hypothetical protein